MSTMLLQEDFPGGTWARRNCDDTGFLNVVEVDGTLATSSGALNIGGQDTPAWDALGMYASAQTRAAGLAILAKVTLSNFAGLTSLAWAQSTTIQPNQWIHAYHYTDGPNRLTLYANGSVLGVTESGSTSTEYHNAIVLRDSGAFYLIKGGAFTEWTLVWVEAAITTATLYPQMGSYNVSASMDTFRVCQLPAPWDTDYGIATDRLAGAITVGTTFTHEADFVMEFTVTARTTIGTNMAVRFRIQDANNFWFIRITSGGVTNLVEYVSGSTDRASSGAGSVATGHRVVIRANDETITAWSNNTQLWSYSSAANFKTETDGEVNEDGDGTLSDLVVYPRTLSGDANTALNRAFD